LSKLFTTDNHPGVFQQDSERPKGQILDADLGAFSAKFASAEVGLEYAEANTFLRYL
jgi:hypothetical protein